MCACMFSLLCSNPDLFGDFSNFMLFFAFLCFAVILVCNVRFSCVCVCAFFAIVLFDGGAAVVAHALRTGIWQHCRLTALP